MRPRAGIFAYLSSALLALAASVSAQDFGCEGPSFTGASTAPTETKPENKLWFNDGVW